MRALGVTAEELDIRPAARQMLADIGHPFARGEPVYDITFENVQAGLRTDYLFRLANQRRGLVLGTGDLSELALGWCTYGVGDHMSHYNVNGSLAKTLIQYLMRWVAASGQVDAAAAGVILSIVDTRDLARARAGRRQRATSRARSRWWAPTSCRTSISTTSRATACARRRSLSSPGMPGTTPRASPGRRRFRDEARHAYDLATIRKWLGVFLRRFFAESQFKRSAMPNGPKVVSGGSLSPRGDWRAPSDGNANVWLAELEANVPSSSSR